MGRQNVKNTIVDNVLEFVAPHLCSGCGKIGTLLCNNCKNDIIKNPLTTCISCGRADSEGICGTHHLPYQNAWIVGPRQGTLKRLIGGYKFQNMKAGARHLAELLDARLPVFDLDTVLVPIPTAASHVRERGYDHILLMTQYLAELRGLSIERKLLGRRETTAQHELSRKERLIQASSAFITNGVAREGVHYIVVDDVLTTGATILNATQLLRGVGATNLSVAVIARQPLD
jgi:ComF family protein